MKPIIKPILKERRASNMLVWFICGCVFGVIIELWAIQHFAHKIDGAKVIAKRYTNEDGWIYEKDEKGHKKQVVVCE